MVLINTTNTSNQIIDSFDLPLDKTIKYDISAVDSNGTSVSYVTINHNGIDIAETQTATAVSGIIPAEFTTSIDNNIGYLKVQPLKAYTTYSIDKYIQTANLYSEHTVSGRIIKADEGIGMYLVNNANNVTVRQSNNNFFGYVNTYLNTNVLGPITTKNELFDYNNLLSFNNSSSVLESNNIVITSSSQTKNNSYVTLNVIPGTIYRISCDAFYNFTSVLANEDTVDIGTRITLGTIVSEQDITYREITSTDTAYSIDFIPTTNVVYLGLGFGALGSKLTVSDLSIKELVPFHTYKQDQGTFYLRWNVVSASATVLNVGNNSVTVDASNNIFINTVNCGSQQTINRLAFVYGNNQITYSTNAGVVVTQTATFYGSTIAVTLNTAIDQLSYVPTMLSNAIIIGLTDD